MGILARFQALSSWLIGVSTGFLLGVWSTTAGRSFFTATNGTNRQRALALALLLVPLALAGRRRVAEEIL